MPIIKVPQPPAEAYNPDRAVSALLKNQILHLQEAEFRLPADRQTNIYVNAIKTEGEAAKYIHRVTMALHDAHGIGPQGMTQRKKVTPMRPRGTSVGDLAAKAADRPAKKKSKKKSKKSAKKKSSPNKKRKK